mgnify:CR=1 FL=1
MENCRTFNVGGKSPRSSVLIHQFNDTMSKSTLIVLLCLMGLFPVSVNAQTGTDLFSGTYRMQTTETELTLELRMQAQQKLTGTLSGANGIQYSLEGQAIENTASGICSDGTSSVYFEIYTEGNELVLSLIEPDAWNNPDYTTATYLSFQQIVSGPNSQTENKTVMNTPMDTQGTNGPGASGQGIGNPAWGFRIVPPEGWTHQESGDGVIMGHNTIPGLILVFPHMLQNLQELRQEMMKGIQEGANYLVPSGTMEAMGDQMMAGDYQGMMDGQQARARGFGTLSPYGGGAFILAVSTPEMLGDPIIRDAERIASSLVYTKIETFVGSVRCV